jgi:hypothetical protein
MNEQRFFADVDLPFHVWVREDSGAGFRWVLKHAADVHRGAPAARGGSTAQGATGRRGTRP